MLHWSISAGGEIMEESSSRMGCTKFFVVLLQVLFIALKLCNVINWCWWWVLSPTLIYTGIILCLLIIAIFLDM